MLLRLAVKEGPFHKHTIATAVLPLHSAVEDFAARRFKPATLEAALEAPDGRRAGTVAVEAQIFSSARTRSIVSDAVRRMKLLVAVRSHHHAGAAAARTPSGGPAPGGSGGPRAVSGSAALGRADAAGDGAPAARSVSHA